MPKDRSTATDAAHPEKLDRRVQRTRQLLQESLITLVLERGYDNITVQDITDHANLGRATFYLHYKDKEELLVGTLEHIYEDLIKNLAPASVQSLSSDQVPSPALIAFRHADQHRDLYRIMLRGHGASAIMVEIRGYIANVIRERLVQMFRPAVPPVPFEVIAQHMTGSLLALIGWWLDAPSNYTAEDMAEMFRQLNTQALLNHFRGVTGQNAEPGSADQRDRK